MEFDNHAVNERDIAADQAKVFAELERQASAGWKWFGGFCAFFCFIVFLVGVLIEVPYIALVPGSARDTEPLLSVDGTDSFASEGEILYTTVSVRQEINLWEYLLIRTDDESEVVPAQCSSSDRRRHARSNCARPWRFNLGD